MNLWIDGCTSISTFRIYSWTMHRLCSLCTLTCWILCLDFMRNVKDSQRLSERLSVFSTLFTSVDFFQIPHTHWVRIFMVPLICISSRYRMQTFFASSLSSNATSSLILFQSDAGFRVTDCIRVAAFTQGPTRLQLIFFQEMWGVRFFDFCQFCLCQASGPLGPGAQCRRQMAGLGVAFEHRKRISQVTKLLKETMLAPQMNHYTSRIQGLDVEPNFRKLSWFSWVRGESRILFGTQL